MSMHPRRSGMTLMELVVAITILAIMATAGGAAFATLIDRQTTISNANTEMERAAAFRETLRQWILQGTIQIQRGGGPRGLSGGQQTRQLAQVAPGGSGSSTTASVTAAASTGNELTVITNAPNPLMAAQARIRLFVDVDDNTPEHGLCIEYQSNQAGAQAPLQRRQLDPDVGDITVEFYDGATSRWYASTQASTLRNAYAVRITLVPADGKTLSRLVHEPVTIVYGDPSANTVSTTGGSP
jgi:prepilin-type N-terminal cleavage/methylation domain-containing protein